MHSIVSLQDFQIILGLYKAAPFEGLLTGNVVSGFLRVLYIHMTSDSN